MKNSVLYIFCTLFASFLGVCSLLFRHEARTTDKPPYNHACAGDSVGSYVRCLASRSPVALCRSIRLAQGISFYIDAGLFGLTGVLVLLLGSCRNVAFLRLALEKSGPWRMTLRRTFAS